MLLYPHSVVSKPETSDLWICPHLIQIWYVTCRVECFYERANTQHILECHTAVISVVVSQARGNRKGNLTLISMEVEGPAVWITLQMKIQNNQLASFLPLIPQDITCWHDSITSHLQSLLLHIHLFTWGFGMTPKFTVMSMKPVWDDFCICAMEPDHAGSSL